MTGPMAGALGDAPRSAAGGGDAPPMAIGPDWPMKTRDGTLESLYSIALSPKICSREGR